MIRVLVVDDDPHILRTLRIHLAHAADPPRLQPAPSTSAVPRRSGRNGAAAGAYRGGSHRLGVFPTGGVREAAAGLEFDDDAAAIHRLLAFVDRQHPMSLHQADLPGGAFTQG